MTTSPPILTADEIETIRKRHGKPECATTTLLAAVFGVSRQRIASVLYPIAAEEVTR